MLSLAQQAVAARSHIDRRLAEAGAGVDEAFRGRLDAHFERLFTAFTDVYGDRGDCLEQLAAHLLLASLGVHHDAAGGGEDGG